MFSNSKISGTQIKKLLAFDIIGVSLIILPGVAAAGAGRDGLISIAIGSVAAIIYGLFFLYAAERAEGDYIAFSLKTLGPFPGAAITVLYIIKLAFSCLFILALFVKVINDTLLPDTSGKIISFSLISVSMYAAAKGIEARARMAEVLFFVVFAPLALLFALGLKRIDLTNIFPLFISGRGEVLYTSYSALLIYSAVEMLLFVPLGKERGNLRRGVIQGVIIAAAIDLVLFILVMGLLGSDGAARQFEAFITIMQLIQIPGGFVQRQDAIMLTLWLFSIFSILSACFYYLARLTNSFAGIKNKNYFLLFYGPLIFFLGSLKIPVEDLFVYYGRFMAYVGFPQSVCVPLVVILVSKIRRPKGGAYEKERA